MSDKSDGTAPGVLEVFISYSHKDEKMRKQLEQHLAILKRQGVICNWHDRRISAGEEWGEKIDAHMNSADVILLLVSAHFLASDYCYDIEMKRAMERHASRNARVIPVILRPCDWQKAPFGKLQALPRDARPVSTWIDRDEAFLNIAEAIRRVATELQESTRSTARETARVEADGARPSSVPHGSPIKILFLSANPTNNIPLRLDEEAREIEEGLRRALRRDDFKLEKQPAVRIRDLSRAILDVGPQIVHFSGHGATEGLVLEDSGGMSQFVSADALSDLFRLFAGHVECVLLNACYSAHQAAAISEHIPYVIGMSKEIGDRAAIEFAVGFYDALGAGRSIEDAYRFGCVAIRLQSIPEHLTPVLRKKGSDASLGDESSFRRAVTNQEEV